jgi:pimeloyl-ACP methyl ester carboxylesterase
LGLRLIVLERPGFGISDFQPGRTLLDWPSDVARTLNTLGIDRFYVAGTSAGGPYVAACAYALRERVRAASIVASGGPLDDFEQATKDMAPSRKLVGRLFRRAPKAMCTLLSALPVPASVVYGVMARASPITGTQAEREALMADVTEALRPGLRGFVYELVVLTRSWGFPLEEIAVPVDVWHGDTDAATPLSMGQTIAARIPTAELHVVEGVGHRLWRSHEAAIVEALVRDRHEHGERRDDSRA